MNENQKAFDSKDLYYIIRICNTNTRDLLYVTFTVTILNFMFYFNTKI